MRVRFWGTRGSLPTPGSSTLRYGGNTSCVEVRSQSGSLIVLDAGTGVRGLGRSLLAQENTGGREGHLLLGHTHWDHIQGLPFFAPLYVGGAIWHIHAPRTGDRSLREILAAQMDSPYFPIPLERLGATIHCRDIGEGEHRIGGFQVVTQSLNHSSPAMGYRLSVDGCTLVYACDHEPSAAWAGLDPAEELPPSDQRHVEFLAGADLVIHDAQYSAQEFAGKRGWGHSSYEYVLEICRRAGVARVALTHHDPGRDDDTLDAIVADLQLRNRSQAWGMRIEAAAEGQTIDLG